MINQFISDNWLNDFDNFVNTFDAENDKSLDFLLHPKYEDIPIVKNIRSSTNQPLPKPVQGRGRPALHLQYPAAVTELEKFLNLHAGGAQERRRTDAVYYNGVTTLQMRDHVRSTLGSIYPRLKTISDITCRRLLEAPAKNVLASKYYKNLINAKIPSKRNDMSCRISDDSHFGSSQVKYGYELASLYPREIISLSCDNKCKIPIDSLAVSRYHQIRRFFPNDHQPNYPDHDFKEGPYITPCNYLELRHNINHKQYEKCSRRKRSRSTDSSEQTSILKMKRSHSEDTSLFSKCKTNNIQVRPHILIFSQLRVLFPSWDA
ncbi:unnamed protein product [Didymodactylos carnosus]|uniref:Uncharacterized protein n=1 Tax=Didymodactylos carnosus TaxID=1234261 RepID=A0A815V5Y7_9BILA|nr:unnamed protein product [Didymodactylos carnosus]CAF1528866.1 unnamed protein product [Didymodactylos carnosus]CAF3754802.1 unnamed protein product [Didymodactylos carnosus]CAF4388056.1 unnamed protein product [Didymodactylos carnosus]